MDTKDQLRDEFRRIHSEHRDAFKYRVAREVLGPSVIRVFAANTKPGLGRALVKLPVEELPQIGKRKFRSWYEIQLNKVAKQVRVLNSNNSRLLPGLKWGHSNKVLSLYLRDMVLHTRYFTETQASRIVDLLYVPIDGIIIQRLAKLGVKLPFRKIREIDSSEKFYEVQDLLQNAAAKVGVPRVWFDDNWADHQV